MVTVSVEEKWERQQEFSSTFQIEFSIYKCYLHPQFATSVRIECYTEYSHRSSLNIKKMRVQIQATFEAASIPFPMHRSPTSLSGSLSRSLPVTLFSSHSSPVTLRVTLFHLLSPSHSLPVTSPNIAPGNPVALFAELPITIIIKTSFQLKLSGYSQWWWEVTIMVCHKVLDPRAFRCSTAKCVDSTLWKYIE